MSKIVDIYSLKEKIFEKEAYQYYYGNNTETKEPVLIKIYSLKFLEKNQTYYFKIINEMNLVEKINSSRILRPLSYLKTSNNMYVIYEYYQQKSLKYWVQQRNEDSFFPRFNGGFVTLMLENLEFLESMLFCLREISEFDILHRDLRPSNFLCNFFF